MKKLSDAEQIKWQKAVIRDEWVEKQIQWEKAIQDDWLQKGENKWTSTNTK